MQKYRDSISVPLNGALTPLVGATVTVYAAGTLTPSSLFSDNSGTATSNPVTSDAQGNFEFYAADGRYDLSIAKTGYTTTSVRDVLLEDPATGSGTFTTLSATGNVDFGSGATLSAFVDVAKSSVGATVDLGVYNSDNTSGSSNAQVRIYSGGPSGGDPILNWEIAGTTRYYMGIDNSNSDKLVIGVGYTPGTADKLTIDSAGLAVTGTTSTTTGMAVGGATAGAGGIAFPATAVAVADVNTLDDYREGTYTATATGMTTAPTCTVSYVKVGNMVTLYVGANSGTSNNVAYTLTGAPAAIWPSAARNIMIPVTDNGGALSVGSAYMNTAGTIVLGFGIAGGAFTCCWN